MNVGADDIFFAAGGDLGLVISGDERRVCRGSRIIKTNSL